MGFFLFPMPLWFHTGRAGLSGQINLLIQSVLTFLEKTRQASAADSESLCKQKHGFNPKEISWIIYTTI